MTKTALIAGAALIAVAGAAWAQTGTTPQPDPNADLTRQQVVARVDQRFARLDVNRDGRFTPEEAGQLRAQRQTARADRMFERLDLNRDGSITREEMSQARAQRARQRDAHRAARAEAGDHRRGHRGMGRRGGHHRFAMRNERMFGEQGFITAEQMRERALARFDRMDADRNGTVTAAERRQARQQMREQFRQRRQERRNQG